MDTNYTLGSLLPIWIICAPLLAAVIMMFTAPKPTSHNSRDRRDEHDESDIRAGGQYGDTRNIRKRMIRCMGQLSLLLLACARPSPVCPFQAALLRVVDRDCWIDGGSRGLNAAKISEDQCSQNQAEDDNDQEDDERDRK